MTLLWARIAKITSPVQETHFEHRMSPVFEAAGLHHSPCADGTCDDYDPEHGWAFEAAFRALDRANEDGADLPVEHVDPKSLHGFEPTADLHTLRRYTRQPPEVPPTAFRHHGRLHLIDGHHRAAAAARRGDATTPVAVVADFDRSH